MSAYGTLFLSSYWVVSSSLDVTLCAFWLMSQGGLFFSEGRVDLVEWEQKTGRRGGRENCDWDVIHERRNKKERDYAGGERQNVL